ncbi:LppU/SCO3897 family protein [Lentzea sp.]|uniref:LppU/SCO3897 family protein n=1 Tax=Lentzea sp. TaxID=56099 RepID=UPI002ED523C4
MIIDEPAAPRTSLRKRIATYAATLVVAAVAIYGMTEFLTPVRKPAQGDCANVTGDVAQPDFDAVTCGSAGANYVVTGTVAKSASCTGSFTDMVPGRAQDPDVRICLVPLWTEGACYPVDSGRMELQPVDCAADAFKVTRVSKDVPGPPCAAGEERFSFPGVTLTYCTTTL